jgi:PleD family two-component response regulator
VAALKIAHSASATRERVTVSIGVTTVEPGGDYSYENAVREADVALYAVKARGRDGWAFHSSPDSGAGDPPGANGGLLKTAS